MTQNPVRSARNQVLDPPNSASRLAALRGRRLLEMQNERLLAELLAARRESAQAQEELAERRARERAWVNSRTYRIASLLSQLMRGSWHQRLGATKGMTQLCAAAMARRLRLRPYPAAAQIPANEPPSWRVDTQRQYDDAWGAWRALCDAPGASEEMRQLRPHGGQGPLRIAMIYTGGLGDILQAAAVTAAIKQDLAPCTITFLHTNKKAPAVLSGDNSIAMVAVIPPDSKQVLTVLAKLPMFDLLVDFQYCIRYIVPPESRAASSAIEDKILTASAFARPWLKFMDDFPLRNNQFGRAAQRAGLTVLDIAGLTGGLDISGKSPIPFFPDMNSYDVVLDLVPKPYITVHNGADERISEFLDSASRDAQRVVATKLLPLSTWTDVVGQLRKHGYSIVQVGLASEDLIPGVTHDLRSSTSLSEVGLIIKHAECHIDTEGGLVHLARAVNRRSVVLFGPTSPDIFGYEQNVNLSASSCSDCWWITNDWIVKCPRGTSGPECMTNHTAESIVAAVRGITAAAYDSTTELLGAQLFTIASMQGLEPLRQQIYDAVGLPYNGLSAHVQQPETGFYVHASKNWEYPFILKAMRDEGLHLRPGLRVADVGGGRGAFSFALGRMGAEIEVFDIDFRWDAQGDAEIEDRFIHAMREVGYARFGSIFNIPADDETYDVVTCVSVVEHIYYKRQAIAELLRILKVGGILALTFDLVEDLQQAGLTDHLRREIFDIPALAEELRAFGVEVMPFDTISVRRSVLEIQEAGVLGIPSGMTVGGVILRKHRVAPPVES